MNLKIGMVGLDTSHCPAFVNLLNDKNNQFHIPNCEIVKAFPGGSENFSLSKSRIDQFTKDVQNKNVEIVEDIDSLAGLDGYFLESVDGNQHLEQFKRLVKFGKPVFIDKPLACNYADAREIANIAREHNIPIMTASAIRYAKGIDKLVEIDETVESCEAFGPMALLHDYRDYFWYGIHSAEVLFSFMGQGCIAVQTFNTENVDVIVGTWGDGRIGTLRGNRVNANNFGCVITTNKATKFGEASGEIPYYALMLKHIIPFFETGNSPINFEESLEIIAFLEAASQSLSNGGKPVKLEQLS
ncbi:MAG: Gfo/Idh/MocA family oxidoreductase [Victivallales bacterium]|nr:Gfo/Idh/MocA family oxidoreductase [Victivallales bacterium]